MPKVLVVDDQAELREMMQAGLLLSGYQVRTAAEGAGALNAAALFAPDLIVLDFNLPGLHGPALCARLRQQAEQASILLISGCASPAEVHASLQAGAREYLRKPFELERLLTRIGALLSEI